MTAVYLLMRMQDYDEAPVFVRAFRSYEAALAACEQASAYLEAPARPQHPQGAPEGFMVTTMLPGVVYRVSSGDDTEWMREEESRILYPAAWALYDARKAAYEWWTQANPVDRGAPAGTEYVVHPVEFTDA